MKPSPALQVYVTDEERRRVRVAAAQRNQTMSAFGHDAIMAEVERIEAERLTKERGK